MNQAILKMSQKFRFLKGDETKNLLRKRKKSPIWIWSILLENHIIIRMKILKYRLQMKIWTSKYEQCLEKHGKIQYQLQVFLSKRKQNNLLDEQINQYLQLHMFLTLLWSLLRIEIIQVLIIIFSLSWENLIEFLKNRQGYLSYWHLFRVKHQAKSRA